MVSRPNRFALVALAVLCLAGTPASAGEGLPSFRKSADREAKNFQERVFTAVIRAARTKPVDIRLAKGEYTDDGKERKELKLTGTYKGSFTRKKFDVTVVIRIDTSNEKEWKVLKINYTDNNGLMPTPRENRFSDLAKRLNE
jgi:hypothetical protein